MSQQITESFFGKPESLTNEESRTIHDHARELQKLAGRFIKFTCRVVGHRDLYFSDTVGEYWICTRCGRIL